MSIFLKSEPIISNNNHRKSLTNTPHSLKRRRSLKSLRVAKLNHLKKSLNGKHKYIGDRFMAHRGVTNFEDIESVMNSSYEKESNINDDKFSIPSLIDKVMRPSKKRILKLTLNHESPTADEKLQNLMQTKQNGRPKINRQISNHPERVLDAPEVLYEYPNIMDWGKNNTIAVALKQTVYLWEASMGTVEELMKYSENTDECISCLKWLCKTPYKSDDMLAVGSSFGNILIWDTKMKLVIRRIVSENYSEIISMSIKDNIFSFGLKCGLVEHHDIRFDSTRICVNRFHNKIIRYLKWSSDLQNLGILSHNNCLSVWTSNRLESSPIVVFRESIYDFVWSPKDENIVLCSIDQLGYLKLFDVIKKVCIKSVNTGSNILCMYWSDIFDEVAIALSEENESSRIKILHENDLSLMFNLEGHRGQIITMVANPTGEVIASIGHDEKIRLWNCFQSPGIGKLKNRRNQKCDFLKEFERFR